MAHKLVRMFKTGCSVVRKPTDIWELAAGDHPYQIFCSERERLKECLAEEHELILYLPSYSYTTKHFIDILRATPKDQQKNRVQQELTKSVLRQVNSPEFKPGQTITVCVEDGEIKVRKSLS